MAAVQQTAVSAVLHVLIQKRILQGSFNRARRLRILLQHHQCCFILASVSCATFAVSHLQALELRAQKPVLQYTQAQLQTVEFSNAPSYGRNMLRNAVTSTLQVQQSGHSFSVCACCAGLACVQSRQTAMNTAQHACTFATSW